MFSSILQQSLTADLEHVPEVPASWTSRLMPQVEAASRLGSWAWNLDTDVIQWSAQMFRIFGLEVGKTAPELQAMARFFSVDGWQRIQEHIAKARVTGQSYQLDVRFKPYGGTWGWCRVHAEIMDRSDGVQGFLVGTCQDITLERTLTHALNQSRSDLRRLVLKVEHAQEDERRRIARDLHDDLQQNLAAIRMMAWQIAQPEEGAARTAENLCGRLIDLVDETLASMRRVVKDLHPHALDRLGLASALEILARDFASQTRLKGEFRLGQGDDSIFHREVDPDVAICLYRIAQEGLNNIRKHARASWFEVKLHLDLEGRVVLRISDDGHGMVPLKKLDGSATGLLSMRERVKFFGGTLQIAARKPKGLELLVSLPYWHMPVMP